MKVEPTITLLESVWGSLADLGDELTTGEWESSTDCPGWNVKAQYSHVIGTESMLAGRPTPEVSVPDLDHLRNDIGRANEAWVLSMADRTPDEVLAAFREITGERSATLRAMTTDEWDAPGFTPEGPGPYRQFMEIRVFDCWFHEQDVREAVDRPGGLSGAVADFALARTGRALGFVVGKKAGAPQHSTVVFTVTGDPVLEFAIGVDGRASLLDESPANPTATLVMDRRTYGRLVGGRRDASWATGSGRVEIAGDDDLALRVLENLGYTI